MNLFDFFKSSKEKTFKNILNSKGFHQANCYDVELSLPRNMGEIASKIGAKPRDLMDLFSVCCYQVQPAVGTLQTATVRTYGEPYEMPSGKTYESLNLGFYYDNGGLLYRFLNEWYNSIFNPETRTMGYLEDYAGTLTIDFTKRGATDNESLESFFGFLLTKGENIVNKIEYTDFFPKAISAVPLNGLSGNTLTMFDVSFNYRRAFLK